MFFFFAIAPTLWAFVWWLDSLISDAKLNGWFIALAALSLILYMFGIVEQLHVQYEIKNALERAHPKTTFIMSGTTK